MTKQLVRFSFAVMTTLLGLAILWIFRTAVVYVLVSVALAAVLRPLVSRLVGRSIFERAGWIVAYLVGFGIVLFFVYFIGKAAVMEIQQLTNTISTQETWMLPAWLENSLFKQVLDTRLLPPNKLFQMATVGQSQSILPALLGFTQSVASTLSGAFIIIVMSLYWMASKTHFERLWLSLLPSSQRKQARDIWQTIEPDLGAFIRNQLLVNVMCGVFLGIGFWLIGLPYPTLLALIEAFACAIPFVGVVLALIIPIVFGLVVGMQHITFIIVYTLLLTIIMGIWVKPRLFNHKWDNPILTLILLVAMSSTFGIIGIIVAPPIAVIIQTVWSLLINQRLESENAVQVSDFNQRQESVWEGIRAMAEPPPPQVTSSLEKLNALLDKARPILQTAQLEEKTERTLPGPPPPNLK